MARSPWKVGKQGKKIKALHADVHAEDKSMGQAATALQFSEGNNRPTTGAWRALQLYIQIFIAPPYAQQHKATYGLAPGYHMANTREVSALGCRKKGTVISAGVRS